MSGKISRKLRARKKKRSILITVCVSIFLFIVGGCLVIALLPTAQKVDTSNTVQSTTLYLDGAYGPEFAGEMMADRRGYFLQHDIKVEVKADPSNLNFVGDVVHNRAIGVTTGQKFLLARWRGEPIIAFGGSRLDTSTAIFTRPNSGLRYPQDLAGKRIAYERGSEDAFVFDAMTARLGVTRSQMHYVSIMDKFEGLVRGDVDAVISSIDERPFPGEAGSTLNVMRPQEYGFHIPGLVYFASSDLVNSSPSIILQTLRAAIAGWQDVYSDPERATQIIVGFDPVRLHATTVGFALSQQRDLIRPTGIRIGDLDESRWKTLEEMLLYSKLGQRTVNLSSVFTYDFLREVYRRPVDAGIYRGSGSGG